MSADLQTPTQAEIADMREAVERVVRKIRESDPPSVQEDDE